MTEQSGVQVQVLSLMEVPCLQTSTKHSPDVILCRDFARPSTALAVIECLGKRLPSQMGCGQQDHVPYMRWGLGMRLGPNHNLISKQNIDEAALKK